MFLLHLLTQAFSLTARAPYARQACPSSAAMTVTTQSTAVSVGSSETRQRESAFIDFDYASSTLGRGDRRAVAVSIATKDNMQVRNTFISLQGRNSETASTLLNSLYVLALVNGSHFMRWDNPFNGLLKRDSSFYGNLSLLTVTMPCGFN